ncbi:hypothetical protein RHMOL_Rhmol09G0165000 [Rhododendron molle]|uniref:Uncharacterized protein n=1 Tax=Rhododendron molle TaxID=49168 RepID=A0ACC0MF54_RHOML|nr:hypothetical protein RHMOL_Rhmol09G0165000 [Rhododendron molle]
MLGFPKPKKKGGKKKQSDLLRSAVAAAALPLSSIGINRTYLDEAHAIWPLTRLCASIIRVMKRILLVDLRLWKPKMRKGLRHMVSIIMIDS